MLLQPCLVKMGHQQWQKVQADRLELVHPVAALHDMAQSSPSVAHQSLVILALLLAHWLICASLKQYPRPLIANYQQVQP